MRTARLDDLEAPLGVTAAGPTMTSLAPAGDGPAPTGAFQAPGIEPPLPDSRATSTIVVHLPARTMQAPVPRRPE